MSRRLNSRAALSVLLALSVFVGMAIAPTLTGQGNLVGAGRWHNPAGAAGRWRYRSAAGYPYAYRRFRGAARFHYGRPGGGHWN